MKTSNKVFLAGLSFLLVVIVIMLVILRNANNSIDRGIVEGNQVIKTYDIKPYSSLKVVGAIDLEYIPSDTLKLSAEVHPSDLEKLEIDSSEGTLTIRCINVYGRSVKCVLESPVFENLEASAGAKFRNDSTISTNKFGVFSQSGSRVNVKGLFSEVVVESSAGSSVLLIGKTVSAIFEANAGAAIRAKEFEIDNATSKASSGASIVVNAKTLSGEASSGAIIKYNKSAVLESISSNNGGSVRPY